MVTAAMKLKDACSLEGKLWQTFVVVVQLLSSVWLCNPMNCSTPGFHVLHHLPSLLKLMFIESVMPSNHLIPCYLFLLLPSIFPSIRVFSKESALHIRYPNYWSFSISPSNEYLGLISFRMNWFDLLAVQGILKSLLQDHNLFIYLFIYWILCLFYFKNRNASWICMSSLCRGHANLLCIVPILVYALPKRAPRTTI